MPLPAAVLMLAIAGCVPSLTNSSDAPSQTTAPQQETSEAIASPPAQKSTREKPATKAPSPKTPPAKSQALPNVGNETGDTYKFALNKAYSAAKLSQSARAMSDWEFVVSRWQEAINLLKTIEDTDTRAAKKIAEYSKNLAYAQQRAAQIPQAPKPIRIQQAPAQTASAARGTPAPRAAAAVPATPQRVSIPQASGAPAPATQSTAAVTKVPIRKRFSGIPIIVVQINGQGFPMMVDTGASTTVVTQAMANVLGLEPVGSVRANTPSEQGVVFQVARLNQVQVGNLRAKNLRAAIAPTMEVGLLGQNFFGAYDVTITRSEVIFRRPS
ncbi:MAG: retropepsin-like aspartic protease [Cyanobacteria bacterium P01_D01_bin.73]